MVNLDFTAQDFIALGSLAVAFLAVALAFWQTYLAQKSIRQQSNAVIASSELQSLIGFREMSRDYKYSTGIDLISNLTADNYESFVAEVSESEQIEIRDCVEFLNFVAILVSAGHIRKQSVWDMYFISYRLVGIKLEPWWFEGQRVNYPNRFSASQLMAQDVLSISEFEIEEFNAHRAGVSV